MKYKEIVNMADSGLCLDLRLALNLDLNKYFNIKSYSNLYTLLRRNCNIALDEDLKDAINRDLNRIA